MEYDEYELLTQAVYQAIVDQDFVENIDVQHDVLLEGISDQEHQIDVYWAFERANEIFHVAIECKHYNSNVEIGDVEQFAYKLEDIGNTQGVMVTTDGYQSGAQNIAEREGISLKVLREPREEDWDERIRRIEIDLRAFFPINVRVQPIPDNEWVRENFDLDQEDKREISFSGKADELYVIDSEGNKLHSIHELQNRLPLDDAPSSNSEHTFKFEDGYIKVPEVGPIKLNGIRFTYDVEVMEEEIIVDGEEVVEAILRDVDSGEIEHVHRN